MTQMKHYHLGCGESLRSRQVDLQVQSRDRKNVSIKSQTVGTPRAKQDRRH